MEQIDEKKLWLKLSSSINSYLRYWDSSLTDDDLLKEYLDLTFEYEEELGCNTYLDKKTFERVKVSDELIDKTTLAFKERVKRKREKYLVATRTDKVVEKKEVKTAKVFKFEDYKK